MTPRLALLLAALASAAGAQSIQQTTSGWCSPTVADTKGNVQITCNGIDPAALKRLNELLDKKDLELSQKTAEAEDWSHKYQELQQQLARTAASGEAARQAQQLLREGRFEQAGQLLDKQIESGGSDLAQRAADHYARGRTYELQFKPLAALPHYEQAYRDQPDDPAYALAYAELLQDENKLTQAEPVYQAALAGFRKQAQADPDAIRPKIARTLDSLGRHYLDLNRLPEAESALSEALQIRREIAAKDPRKSSAVAASLNNLANVFNKTRRGAQAESAYEEALGICRKSADQACAAVELENLGMVYLDTHRPDEALKAKRDAVEIWRDLVKKRDRPKTEFRLAEALDGLAQTDLQAEHLPEAEQAEREALDIARKLAKDNPDAYLRRVGAYQNVLGTVYTRMRRYGEAESALTEAVKIRRKLAAQEPEKFSPMLVKSLNEMGLMYKRSGQPAKAEQAYREAKEISRRMQVASTPKSP